MRKGKAKIQSILSIVLASIIVMSGVTIAFAEDDVSDFILDVYPNIWGQSNVRKYLNSKEGGYISHFNKGEYDLIKPSTIETNICNSISEETAVIYETTDKFFLPSGRCDSESCISWGKEDISDSSIYTQKVKNKGDLNRMIPISYWASSDEENTYSWLRSTYYDNLDLGPYVKTESPYPIIALRGNYIFSGFLNYSNSYVAPVFRINLNSVIFSSVASADDLNTIKGGVKFEVSNKDLGKRSNNATADYGMYLKKKLKDCDFKVTNISYENNNIIIDYIGGSSGKYITICAFQDDNMNNKDSIISYGAAEKITADGTGSVVVNVSNWELSDIPALTCKIWMEDLGTDNLANATQPNTWEYNDRNFRETAFTTNKNNRVFAVKEGLQCSWGKLNKETDLIGSDATNQKIYFGKDSEGRPMQFWIAGREDNYGSIDSDGDIMCLYQAKAVEKKCFNDSAITYVSKYEIPDLSTIERKEIDIDHDRTSEYNEEFYGVPEVFYQYCTADSDGNITGTEWNDGMPMDPGTYRIRVVIPREEGNYKYEQVHISLENFTVLEWESASIEIETHTDTISDIEDEESDIDI